MNVHIVAFNNIHSYPRLNHYKLGLTKISQKHLYNFFLFYLNKKKKVLASKITFFLVSEIKVVYSLIENKLKISVRITLESKSNNADIVFLNIIFWQ